MRLKENAADFVVEEQIELPPPGDGSHTVYRVRKQGITSLAVRAEMAALLHRSPSAIHIPALKDKNSIAVQYLSLRGSGPRHLSGRGFEAERVARAGRPLRSSDLRGNRFTIVVRDLPQSHAQEFATRLQALGETGLPNYFDRQRFGSQTASGDWPGKRILRRDAQGALRIHLIEPQVGDPPRIREFKRRAAAHWQDWQWMLDAAPRPSNYRSVLTFLCDHPTDWRRALNLVTPRVLSIYLAAYQSLLWNRIAARYLTATLGASEAALEIAAIRLPLPPDLRPLPGDATIPLPHHRAVYAPSALARAAQEVLAEEETTLHDLKARILRRTYLARNTRPLVLLPQDVTVHPPQADDLFPGQSLVQASFTLPPGAYATLVLKTAAPL